MLDNLPRISESNWNASIKWVVQLCMFSNWDYNLLGIRANNNKPQLFHNNDNS